MKNLFILFLFALPLSFLNAQEVSTIGAGAGSKYECEVSCLFNKCKIKCDPDQGVANCGCWFGIHAQCTCGGTSNTKPTVEQTAAQRAALLDSQAQLSANGYDDVAEALGNIQTDIDNGADISGSVNAYISLIESKPGDDQRNIDGLISGPR